MALLHGQMGVLHAYHRLCARCSKLSTCLMQSRLCRGNGADHIPLSDTDHAPQYTPPPVLVSHRLMTQGPLRHVGAVGCRCCESCGGEGGTGVRIPDRSLYGDTSAPTLQKCQVPPADTEHYRVVHAGGTGHRRYTPVHHWLAPESAR